MSRKGGTAVPKERRNEDEYRTALRRIYSDMVKRADEYDQGDDDQALWLAGHLRVLLHHGQGRPLLWLLRLTPNLDMVDTGPEPAPGGGQIIMGGLVHVEATYGGVTAGEGRIRPNLGARYGTERRRRFQNWWHHDKVILGEGGKWFTRQFVVTRMANEDAFHFDPYVTGDYRDLKLDQLGMSATAEGRELPMLGNVAYASVRQVAWEVIATLEVECADILENTTPKPATSP